MLPQVDYASISVNHPDARRATNAATDDRLPGPDTIHYAEQEGACYHAVSEAVVVPPNLAADERFAKYGEAAAEAGIRSQAGLRLFTGAKSQGVLNLCSTKAGAFDDFEALGAVRVPGRDDDRLRT